MADRAKTPTDTHLDGARRVAVVEDDEAIRVAFANMVAAEPGLMLDRQVGSLSEAQALLSSPPDLALIDLMLPDGSSFEFITTLSEIGVRIIVISVLGDERAVTSAFRAGAHGYLLKGATGFEMRDAIFQALAGNVPVSPSIARYLISEFQNVGSLAVSGDVVQLSPREREVLSCLAMGNTDKETARLLGVSPYTVADHVRSVFRKLEVKTRAAAVARAIRDGQLRSEGA